MRFLSAILVFWGLFSFSLFAQTTCTYTAQTTPASCYGGTNGKIVLQGGGSGETLGQLYTCLDGDAVSGSSIIVGAGQVKRVDGSQSISSVIIDGGTLITCGSTLVNTHFEIKNGGTLFCIGSFTSNAPVVVPAGSRIINMYQAMTYNQQIDVAGLLFNINGSLQCQTQLNVTGKVVNWTDFGATNFTVLSTGLIEHHGRWDTKWGAGLIASGGQFKVYGNSSTAVQQFTNHGAVIASGGVSSCFKILSTYASSSVGRVYATGGAQLQFCFNGIVPAGSTIESGVTQNNNSTVCSNCTNIPPDQVDVNSFFGNTATCSVAWTSNNPAFTAVTGNFLTISNLGAGTYTAVINCPGCNSQTLQTTVTAPAQLVLTINKTATSAEVAVVGGTSPYTYAWTGAAGYTASTASISGLAAGTYNVTVTDSKGCTAQQSATVTGSTSTCNYTYSKTNPNCYGSNTGSITLNGLTTGNSGLGQLYTCTDGVVVTGTSVTVNAGEVKRIEGSNTLSSIVINGGTLITCGSTLVNTHFEIKNGGTLFCIGSFTSNAPVVVPAGSRIINMYQAMSFNQQIDVAGLLYNVNGSLQCQTQLNITGKVVNWTDFGATNFTVLSGGVVEHHGRWDTKWGLAEILTGGQFKVYGNSSTAIQQLTHKGGILAEAGALSCFKVTNTYNTTSTGRIYTQNSAQLQFCYGGTIPSGSTIESGVTQNNSTVCAACTNTPPDPVDVNTLFGGGSAGCTVSWTSTNTAFVAVSGNYSTISNLGAGVYTATITCPGCTAQTVQVTLTAPAQLVLTITKTATSAEVAVAGGTAPYTYAWTGPSGYTASTASITSLPGGTYNVTVTDSKGCTQQQSVDIIGGETGNCNYTYTKTNPGCLGSNTGSITLNGLASGSGNGNGLLGHLYTCSEGVAVTGTSITVNAGEVKRIEGSNTLSSVIIDGGTLITCGSTLVNTHFEIKNGGTLFCIGSFTSNAPVVVPAGSRIINMYQAMSFNQQIDVAGLLYNVNGSLQCQTQLNITGKVVNWTDFGATNFTVLSGGMVEHHGRWDTKWGAGVIASGGQFKVYGNSSTGIQQFTNNGAVITQSGNASCFKVLDTYAAASAGRVYTQNNAQLQFCYGGTIPSGSTIESGVTQNNSTVCAACTNTPPDPVDVVTLFDGSGTGTICTVSWTSTNPNFVPVSGNYASISNLGAGVYTATITCPGCTAKTIQITLTESSVPAIIASVSVSGATATVSAPSGGNGGPYKYRWSLDNQITTTGTRTFTANGNYTVAVIDAGGCEIILPFTVTAITEVNCRVKVEYLAGNKVLVQVICPEDECKYQIQTATGSLLAYGAIIPQPCKDSIVTSINCKGDIIRTGVIGSGLCNSNCNPNIPGSCPCNVATDPNCVTTCFPPKEIPCPCDKKKDPNCNTGCVATDGSCPCDPLKENCGTGCDPAKDPGCLYLKVTYTAAAPKCGTLGTATLTITDGSGDYSIYTNKTTGPQNLTLSGLPSGPVTVTVIDNATKQKKELIVTIPATPKSTVALQPVIVQGSTCNNQFMISVSNAVTGPYTIDMGCCAPYYIASLPATGGSLNAGPYAVPTDGGEGPFTVKVTDSYCTVYNLSVTKCNIKCTTPESVAFVPNFTTVKPTYQGKKDGSITLTNLPAGVTAYWSGTDIATPVQGNALTGIGKGDYSLVLLSSSGCIFYENSGLTLQDGGTYIPRFVLTAGCTYNTITARYFADGTPDTRPVPAPLQYVWLNPLTGGQLATGAQVDISTITAGLTLDYLMVRVTDAAGNSALYPFQIPVACRPVTTCTGSFEYVPANPICNNGTDGSIRIVAIPANSQIVWITPALRTPNPNGFIKTGLKAGKYTVAIVSSTSSCPSRIQDIYLANPEPLLIQSTELNPGARITVTKGTAPYTIEWRDGPKVATRTDLVPGTQYIVDVTDAKGCKGTYPFTYSPCSVNPISAVAVFADTKPNSRVTIVASGGVKPWAYKWNDNNLFDPANHIQENLPGNKDYQVSVTDARGCSTLVEVAGGNCKIMATVNTTATSFQDVCDGTATIEIKSNGNTVSDFTGWTILWDNVNIEESLGLGIDVLKKDSRISISHVCGGKHEVFVVNNASSCGVRQPFSVEFGPKREKPTCTTGPIITPSSEGTTYTQKCFNDPLDINFSVAGGLEPYYYDWVRVYTTPGGSFTQTYESDKAGFTNPSYGSYTVTVRDQNGCKATQNFTVNGAPAALVLTPSVSTQICTEQLGSASVQIAGGKSPFAVVWTKHTSQNNLPVPANPDALVPDTLYNVKVTDALGCANTATVMVRSVQFDGRIYSSDDSLCPRKQVVLTARVIPGYNILWSGPGVAANTSTTRIYVDQLGTYTLTYALQVPAAGCGQIVKTITLAQKIKCGTAIKICDNSIFTATLTLPEPEDNCKVQKQYLAESNANNQYSIYIQQAKQDFRSGYKAAVMGSLSEQLTKTYTDHEGHYTLYYYDQAGNIVRTVPPAGVTPLNSTDTETAIAKMKAGSTEQIYTEHQLPTTYQYNSLNQLVAQDMPDHRQQDLWTTTNALNLAPGQQASTVNYLNATQGILFANTSTETKLYTTNDAGKNWTASQSINLSDILDIHAYNGATGFAVGKKGLFLKGLGGSVWTLYASPTILDLINVYFTSATEGRIVAVDGTIWSTADGGLTWTSNLALKNTGISNITDIWNENGVLVVAGEQNSDPAIYYSSNSGTAFTKQIFTAAPYGAIASDGTNLYVGGNLGALYRLDAFGKLHVQNHTNLGLFIRQLLIKGGVYTALVTSGPATATGDIYTSPDGKVWTAATTSGTVKALNDLEGNTNPIAAITTAGTYTTNASWSSFAAITATNANGTGTVTMANLSESRYTAGALLTTPAVSSRVVVAGGNTVAYKTTTGWQKVEIQNYWENTLGIYVNGANDWLLIGSDEKLYRTQLAPAVSGVVPPNTLALRTNVGTIGACVKFYKAGTSLYVLKTNGMLVKLTPNADGSVTAADQYGFPAGHGSWDMTDLRLTQTGNGLNAVVTFHDGTLWQRDGIAGTWVNGAFGLVPAGIKAVTGLTESNVYAAGSNGEIYKKTNTWTAEWAYQPLYSTDITMQDAYFDGTSLRVAAGADLKIYNSTTKALVAESTLSGTVNETVGNLAVTQDGKVYTRSGAAWTQSFSDPEGKAITDVTTGLAAGTQQIYYLNGAAWAKTPPVKIQPIQAVAQGSNIVAVGNNNTILVSGDGGASWQAKALAVAQNQVLTAVATKGTQIVAGSASGGVYYSNTSGDLWTAVTTPGTGAVRKIVMPVAGKAWVLKGNTLLYSANMSTYTAVLTAADQLYGLSIDAEGYGFVVGDNGAAYRIQPTASFTASNKIQASCTTTPVTPVLLAGTTYSYVKICNDANIADDKGSGLGAVNFRSTQFTDRLTGYVTGVNGLVEKTTDGGYHWKKEDGGSSGTGTPILALGDRENGTLVDANGTVKSLNDRAQLWATKMWYDELGRMTVVQTAKQYNIEKYLTEQQYVGLTVPGTGTIRAYSITLYDEIGRISETAELLTRSLPPIYKQETQIKYDDVVKVFSKSGVKIQITNTYYDEAVFSDILSGFEQKNLRPMIASVTYREREGGATYDRASHYSYDIHKNVNALVQEINVAGMKLVKKIDYDYDLVSGKVNYIYYQKDQPDMLIHHYEYDGDNRMVTVTTSRDGENWTNDASYQYYAHEGVARTDFGQYNVETQNYAYTVQGWEKAVLAKNFSYALGYNNNDYQPIGNVAGSPVPLTTSTNKGMFNSNIATVASVNIKITDTLKIEQYEYDQMNRLIKSSIQGATANNFSTTYAYDGNTNLKTITRYNKDGLLFDNLHLNYESKIRGYAENTNKLRSVSDVVLNSSYADDIENQDIDNFQYDESGNLVYDDQEGTEKIEWNANNKIRYLKRRTTSSKPDLEFVYDANMRNRVAKIVKYKNGTVKTTFYINDAAGNLLATYSQTDGAEIKLKEHYIYGAVRLGTLNAAGATTGDREYELTDNLGSIRATVSDFPAQGGYITNAFDYYPYGMIARSHKSSGKYHFGFNGWERDDEAEKGDGNEYGTDYRQYDARTGRYSGVDPLAITLPAYSPYNHALGNPIKLIDSEGDWPKPSASLEEMGMKLPPLVAGLIDGLADGSPIGMVGMAWDICTDAKFRTEMINAFTEIAKDPVGFLGAMFSEYADVLARVASGKATPEDMKMIGEEIGSSIAGALTGSAMTKIFGKVKVFQKLKIDGAKAKKMGGKSDGKTPILDCPLCFTALTQIQTSKGLKDIKDIAVGDSVLSFDELSGKFKFQKVDNTHIRYADTIFVIYAADAHVETTSEHPFFINGEWIRAQKLKAGDMLTLASGEKIAISKIDLRLERTKVFNFTVENFSTYTVGNYQILVHNCKGKSGFYEVKSNGVETYVGKGGEKRAKISLKNHVGNDVYHFDISKGVAGFSVDQTAFIFEAMHMDKAAGKLANQGKQALENKIKSPGHKLITELSKTKAGQQKLQQLSTEYNKLIQQGGKKL